MVVRTAAGVPPARLPDEEVGASSAAAACAEASRELGAPGTGTFGEVSGKNPRPCLPDGDLTLPSLPAAPDRNRSLTYPCTSPSPARPGGTSRRRSRGP